MKAFITTFIAALAALSAGLPDAQADIVIQREFDPAKNGAWSVIDLGTSQDNQNAVDPKKLAVGPDGTVYLAVKAPLDGPPLEGRILKIQGDSAVSNAGSGLEAGDVGALFADDGGLYAATKGTAADKTSNLYRLNGGVWTKLAAAGLESDILSLAALDGVLYAGTNNDGVYRLSGNQLVRVGATTTVLPEGYSWELVGDYAAELEKLAATSLSDIFTIGKDHRVRRYDGLAWEDLGNLSETTYDAEGVPLTTPLRELKSIALFNGAAYVGTKGRTGSTEGADKGAVWRWNGASWDRLGATAMNKEVKSLIPFSENDILAGTNEGGVFQWDGGTWTARNTGLPPTDGKINADTLTLGSDGNLYVALKNKLYRSVDHAANWTEVGFFPFGEEIRSIGTDASGNVFVGVKLGAGTGMVFRLVGDAFVAVGEEFGKEVRSLLVLSTTEIYASLGGGGGSFRWDGVAWESILGDITGNAADFKQLLLLGTDYLAATKNGVQQGLFTNDVTTIGSPLLQKETNGLWVHDGALFAGLKLGGVFRLQDDPSTDDGRGFVKADLGLPEVELSGFRQLGDEIVALGMGSLLYSATQGGAAEGVDFDPLGSNPGQAVLDGDGNLIFTGETAFSSVLRYGDLLFAGTADGLFHSSDEGVTWELFNGPAEVRDMLLLGSKLYVAVRGELTPDPVGAPTVKVKTASVFILDLNEATLGEGSDPAGGGCSLARGTPRSGDLAVQALLVLFVLGAALLPKCFLKRRES